MRTSSPPMSTLSGALGGEPESSPPGGASFSKSFDYGLEEVDSEDAKSAISTAHSSTDPSTATGQTETATVVERGQKAQMTTTSSGSSERVTVEETIEEKKGKESISSSRKAEVTGQKESSGDVPEPLSSLESCSSLTSWMALPSVQGNSLSSGGALATSLTGDSSSRGFESLGSLGGLSSSTSEEEKAEPKLITQPAVAEAEGQQPEKEEFSAEEEEEKSTTTTSEEYDIQQQSTLPMPPESSSKLEDLTAFTPQPVSPQILLSSGPPSGLFHTGGHRRTLSGELSTVSEVSEPEGKSPQSSSSSSPEVPTAAAVGGTTAVPPGREGITSQLPLRPSSVLSASLQEVEEEEEEYMEEKQVTPQEEEGAGLFLGGEEEEFGDYDREGTLKARKKFSQPIGEEGEQPEEEKPRRVTTKVVGVCRGITSGSSEVSYGGEEEEEEGEEEENSTTSSGSFMVGEREEGVMSDESPSISMSEGEIEEECELGEKEGAESIEGAAESTEEESLPFSFRKQDISRTEIEYQMPEEQQQQQREQKTTTSSYDTESKEHDHEKRDQQHEYLEMEEEEEEGHEVGGESSQATDRDFAKSEFSLEHQDSLEGDSLSALPSSQLPEMSSLPPITGVQFPGPPSRPASIAGSLPIGMRRQASLDETVSSSNRVHPAGKPAVPSKAHLKYIQPPVSAAQKRGELLRSRSQDVPPSIASMTGGPPTTSITGEVSTDVTSFSYHPLPSSSQPSSVSTRSTSVPYTESTQVLMTPQPVPPPPSSTGTASPTTTQEEDVNSPQQQHVKSVTIDIVYKTTTPIRIPLEEEDSGICAETYHSQYWYYISKKAEMDVWMQRLTPKVPVDDSDLTESEKSFRKSFNSLTHRMVHRKASMELFKKILTNTYRKYMMVMTKSCLQCATYFATSCLLLTICTFLFSHKVFSFIAFHLVSGSR